MLFRASCTHSAHDIRPQTLRVLAEPGLKITIFTNMNLLNIAASVLSSVILFPALILNRNKILCNASQDESYCTSEVVYEKDKKHSIKIAVIGSGIGGSASAYFARKLFGSKANIDVYEASDQVGGRLGVVEVAGRFYESGGSIIHPKNLYMSTFVKELGKWWWCCDA